MTSKGETLSCASAVVGGPTPQPRRHLRNRYLAMLDVVGLVLALFLSYLIRFEGTGWWAAERVTFLRFLAVAVPLKLMLLQMAGLYRRFWRYAGVTELESIVEVMTVSGALTLILGGWLLVALGYLPQAVPLSVLVVDAILTSMIVVAPRLLIRVVARRSA